MSCCTDKTQNKVKCVKRCVDAERTTGSGWVVQKWISESGKWLILTYCCRNVSVGRVIGIHIGRVMGGGEHSVVVDSESWTKTTERNSDSHLDRHITEDSERRTAGGTWCAGIRRSDAELSAQWQRGLALVLFTWGLSLTQCDSTHQTQVYTWSLYNFKHLYKDLQWL